MTAVDPRLRETLRAFSRSALEKWRKAFAGRDFAALRRQLAGVRDRALERNEELIVQFTEEARKHGSTVLRARDSAEANARILAILQRHGVRKLVKSKSMVSEETRLNAYLTGHGIEACETDLGEWIIQLAGEPPTHMVMPAIHLTRGDVARIFSARLGRSVPEDITAQVRIAREEVRKEILGAQAGLTGANALIAENGAILLITNEGNGRLVTSVPPVHIVLASIEKLLPTIAEALLLLELLPRSATGQALPSYVSLIAGPHREAQYIVLLDNHRSELRDDPVFRKTLRCIKCSACLNVCPVYLEIGGKAYSYIYMGGIGSLLTAWVHGLREAKKLAGLCLGCHRCEEVCPVEIPIADLVRSLKGKLREDLGPAPWKRILLDGVIGHPGIQAKAFGLGRAARPLISAQGYSRGLPAGMRKYDRFRALPAPAVKPLSRLFQSSLDEPSQKSTKPQITLFPGCLVENFYPQVGLAAIRVLARLGYDTALGPSACCGFPAANSGHPRSAARSFRRLWPKLEGAGIVLTLCPTCTIMLERIGPELLGEEKPAPRKPRIYTFSHFLLQKEGETLRGLLSGKAPPLHLTYQDSCHQRHLRNSQDSRSLLGEVLGQDLAEMDESAACCGFAGAFSLEHPEISQALLRDKLAAIRATGAETVVSDCPGCILQIRGGCRRTGLGVEVRHTAELLDALLP